jgi:hypothetical protein
MMWQMLFGLAVKRKRCFETEENENDGKGGE